MEFLPLIIRHPPDFDFLSFICLAFRPSAPKAIIGGRGVFVMPVDCGSFSPMN